MQEDMPNKQGAISFLSYLHQFESGAVGSWPALQYLLEATAEANNRNALAASTRSYKKNMDGVAGPRSRFVAERRLDEWHQYSYASALAHFVTKANMGSRVQIATFRQQLEGEVAAEHMRYIASNREKDPYKGLERYIIPLGVGLVSYVARLLMHACVLVDTTGALAPVCGVTAEMLGFVYTLVFTFLLIIAASGASKTMERAKTIWMTLTDKGRS